MSDQSERFREVNGFAPEPHARCTIAKMQFEIRRSLCPTQARTGFRVSCRKVRHPLPRSHRPTQAILQRSQLLAALSDLHRNIQEAPVSPTGRWDASWRLASEAVSQETFATCVAGYSTKSLFNQGYLFFLERSGRYPVPTIAFPALKVGSSFGNT
jgi:hypothetical protein